MHVLISRLRKTLEGTGSVDVLRDSIALGYEGRYRWDAKTFEEIAQQALGGGPFRGRRRPQVLQRPLPRGIRFTLGRAPPHRAGVALLDLLEAAVERSPGGLVQERSQARLDAFLDI